MVIAQPLAAAVLLSCVASEAPWRPLTVMVDLRQVAGLPPRQLRAMAAEAEALWRAAGIVLTWRFPGDPPPVAPSDDTVTVATAAPSGTAPARLGAVLFLEGRVDAERAIELSVTTIARLVEDARWSGRRVRDWPPSVRDDLTARALGRVLAHEIGHYLLAWRGHPAAGLMRARFPADLLISPDRTPFALSPVLARRLQARLPLLMARGRAAALGTR